MAIEFDHHGNIGEPMDSIYCRCAKSVGGYITFTVMSNILKLYMSHFSIPTHISISVQGVLIAIRKPSLMIDKSKVRQKSYRVSRLDIYELDTLLDITYTQHIFL